MTISPRTKIEIQDPYPCTANNDYYWSRWSLTMRSRRSSSSTAKEKWAFLLERQPLPYHVMMTTMMIMIKMMVGLNYHQWWRRGCCRTDPVRRLRSQHRRRRPSYLLREWLWKKMKNPFFNRPNNSSYGWGGRRPPVSTITTRV